MAKAAKIQDTVQLLCKIFTDCGIPKISPETFRQAKFDKPEACECLWQFLFHVVTFLEHIKENTSESYRPGKVNVKPALCVAKVKIFFYNLGYARNGFYNVTYLSGSRELLLAFGWLLNEVQLLTIMRAYHLEQAHTDSIETNSGYHLVVSSLFDEVLCMEEDCADINAKLKSRDHLSDCIQKLTWLNGRICMSYRQLAETYASLVKLMHQLDRYSHNETRQTYVSFYGWYLLMHPRELSRQMKRLEHHTFALQSIMEWQQHDKIFWKWMESVIDAHKKAEIKSTSDESGKRTKPLKVLSVDAVRTEVNDLYKKLAQMLSEKESQIRYINQIWESKSSQIDAVELKKEMHRIDGELEYSTIYYQFLEQQTSMLPRKCPININKLIPEFIYVPTNAKSHRSSSNLEQVSELNTVEEETCRLKQSIAKVNEKLSLLRTELQVEFDKVISGRKLTAFCM